MLSVYAPWIPVYKNREPWVFSFAANILEEYILNIKDDFTMPPSIYVRGIYWSLWLNLSILLLNGVMSVDSASAADEIITDNQALDKSTLNTNETAKATYLPDSNQVIAVAELKQKVISGKQIESIVHQKQPQITSQTNSSEIDDASIDTDKIRRDLLIDPIYRLTPKKPSYRPGLNFAGPSAFGANIGDGFVAGSGAFGGKRDTGLDGSITTGFGLGDARKLAGVELGWTIGSINNFNANGTFDIKVHRIVYNQATNQVGVAAGWNTFAQYGDEPIRPSSAYGVATAYSLLKPKDPVNQMPISFSLGAGGGDFRQGNSSTGIFTGVGVQVHPQVGLGLGWSGVGLNIGASYVPFPTVPLTITAQGADITNNSQGGTVFVLGVGYGFNFLPK